MKVLDSLIEEILYYGHAQEKDVDIFRDYTPEDASLCITLREYDGSAPARFTQTSVRYIQVECRGKSNVESRARCWDIFKSLYRDDLYITLDNKVCLLQMKNTPRKIDVDAQRRHIWAFNLALTTNFELN